MPALLGIHGVGLVSVLYFVRSIGIALHFGNLRVVKQGRGRRARPL